MATVHSPHGLRCIQNQSRTVCTVGTSKYNPPTAFQKKEQQVQAQKTKRQWTKPCERLRFNNWALAHHVKRINWILDRSGRNDGMATVMLEYRAHAPKSLVLSPRISELPITYSPHHSPRTFVFFVDCQAQPLRHVNTTYMYAYAWMRRPAQLLACPFQLTFPYSHGHGIKNVSARTSRCSNHTRST